MRGAGRAVHDLAFPDHGDLLAGPGGWTHDGWTVLGALERSGAMRMKTALYFGFAAFAIAVVWVGSALELGAQQAAGGAVPIDSDDIGGVVTGPKGPEAGVWVIAETTDLATRFARIVVTDDQGRYVVPDLPNAKYKVWVRGYGLIDSPKVTAAQGASLNLTAG